MRVATSKTADFHTNYLDSKPSALDFLIFYDTLMVDRQPEIAPMNVKVIKIVAYYRVSTKKQGRSGLGLEAQKEMVHQLALAHGATIIAEYVEVETGKKSARPKLREAIHHARLTNSTLVVAKLDRLARNCYFLNCLLHAELDFVCCDNPYADRFNIQVLAAVAEHEARQIAARTKAALAAAKAKGRLLGSARPGCWDGYERGYKKAQPLGSAANSQKARERYQQVLVPEIKRRREEGQTLNQIAAWLNEQGFKTRPTKRCPQGSTFNLKAVWRLIERYLGKEYLGNITLRQPACAACN
jgi:DNA invertase Pin-like site-specific DNA recombinase